MKTFKVGDIVRIDCTVPIIGNRIGKIIEIYNMYGAIIKLVNNAEFAVDLSDLSEATLLEQFEYKNCIQPECLGEMFEKGFEEGLNKNMTISFIQPLPRIVDVIYHEPATIVKWSDGSKTVVKCGENDTYDPEKGLAMCISKKALGNNGNYYELFKKWLPKEDYLTKEQCINILKDLTTNIEKNFSIQLKQALDIYKNKE